MYNSYLISLANEVIRRKQSISEMEKVFGTNGFQVIDAFDARKFYKVSGSNGDFRWWLDRDNPVAVSVEKAFGLSLNDIYPADFTSTDKWLHQNPGGSGCMLSHGYTWDRFLESGKKVAFIAEDDIIFTGDVKRELDLLAQFTAEQKEPTIISTYYFEQARIELKKQPVMAFGKTALYVPLNPEVVFSSVGVFMNRSAATNLRETLFPLRSLPDWFGKFQRAGWIKNFWCANPFLSRPSGEPTTIATNWSGGYERHKQLHRRILHEGAEIALKFNIPVLKPYVVNRRNRLFVQGGTYFVD